MKALGALLALLLTWFVYRHFTGPITHPAGVLVEDNPVQVDASDASEIAHGSYQLKTLARFSINARLLHRKRYRYDRQAELAPIDLAVGWGRMSDQAVLDRLRISQSMRFYWYEYRLPPPIPQDEIVRHSTNLHIIPRDRSVEKACGAFRVGELIHLEGELVEATVPGIGAWRSSLRRDDIGNGACELLFVEEVGKLKVEDMRAGARLVSR